MAFSENNDQDFEHKVQLVLDQAVEDIDAKTAMRLQQIRKQALVRASESQKRDIPWMIPAGGFATLMFATVLSISIWNSNPTDESIEASITVALDDMDLFTASESLEFFEQLEFYAWLDETNAEG